MKLIELAHKETILYSETIEICNQPETAESKKRLSKIHLDYKEVHQCYADLASGEVEALKRGLFIQWYALSEPFWLTGINGLYEDAENKILLLLNDIIRLKMEDDEIIWMLNYYWEVLDIPFTRLKEYKPFDPRILNDKNNHLPESIDRHRMQTRGQMGKYWNSLNHFTNPSV